MRILDFYEWLWTKNLISKLDFYLLSDSSQQRYREEYKLYKTQHTQ